MKCETNQKRDNSIDFIRSIACMAVVLMHVVSTFWYSTPVRYLTLDEYYGQQSEYISELGVLDFQSVGWYVCSMIDAFTRFSVPCFVMISGALVLNKEEIPMGYLWRKFKHIVKIVVSWGCIIGLLTIISASIFFEPIRVSSLVRTMINGNGVFWFLYMLLPLYMASPVLKIIISKNETGLLFVALWFLLSIILPFVKVAIPSLTNNVNLEYMNLFSAYTGYYAVGGILYAHMGGGNNVV